MTTESEAPHAMTRFDLAAVCTLALFILIGGIYVLRKILETAPEERSNLWGERLGQYTLQILGLTFILPTILIIAVATGLKAEAITALLGSIIGYIFGSSRSIETAPPQALSTAQAQPKAAPAAPPAPEAPPTSQASPAQQPSPAPETPAAPPHTPPSGVATTGS